MAQEIKDIKKFVELSRRKDVRKVTLKKQLKRNAVGKPYTETKFKIRGAKKLYTIVINDSDKASKLKLSFAPTLEVEEVK